MEATHEEACCGVVLLVLVAAIGECSHIRVLGHRQWEVEINLKQALHFYFSSNCVVRQ
jgi:hypothetical protein